MEKQEVGLLPGACHTPGLNPAYNIPARQRQQLYFTEENRLREGKSLAQGHTARQNQVGSQVCLTLLKLLPFNHLGSGEREQRCLGVSEQRGYIGNMRNGSNESHKVT